MPDWVRLTPSLGQSYPCSLGGLPLDHGRTNAAARQLHGVSRLAVFIGAWALLWAEPASCRSHGHHVHARGLAKRHYSSGERLAHHRGHGRRTSAKSYAASALARGEDEAPLDASDEVADAESLARASAAGTADGTVDRPQILSIVSPADLLEFGNQTVRSHRGPGFLERYAAVRRGESFASLLAMYDVSRERAQSFENAARPIFDLSNIEPRRSLSLFFESESGQLAAVEYAIDGTNVLVVERQPDGELRARIARTPTSVEIRGVSGTISEGLHVDCSEAGVPDRIVRELVDIFAWDVDFDAMQPGDHFRALYEVAVGEQGEVVQTGAVVAAEVGTAGHVLRALYHADEDGSGSYYDPEGRSLDRGMLRFPLEFVRISSGFSSARFHPVLHRTRAHKGVDFAAPTGTPVRAIADGYVTTAGWQGQLGYAVKVAHGGDRSYTSIYGHLSRISRGMREGEAVRKGEILGYVGSTGLATGPHLHFSLLEADEYVDPLSVTPPPRIEARATLGDGFERTRAVLLSALDGLGHDGPVRLTRVAGTRAPAAAERPLLISY